MAAKPVPQKLKNMLLHYIDRNKTKLVEETDNLIVKTALIISDNLYLETGVSSFIFLYITLFSKDITTDEYLSLLITMHPDNPAAIDTFVKMQKLIRKTNPAKLAKHAQQMKAYRGVLDSLARAKADQKARFDKELHDKKLAVLLDFFDGKRIFLEPVKHFNIDKKDEDPYIEWIKFSLCKTTSIPVFVMPPEYYANNYEFEFDEENAVVTKFPDIISLPLYKIPDISDLTYEQLNYTRLNILHKAKEINEWIDNLRKESFNYDYDNVNFVYIFNLLHENINKIEDLQKNIDNEIYLQHAKNSGKNISMEVSLGITSLRTIAGFFEKAGALLPYIADVLYQRMDHDENATRCGVFINIRIEEENV